MSDPQKQIEREMEMARLDTQASKAIAVIKELKHKILERKLDIQRMVDHISVQEKIHADSLAQLAQMEKAEQEK